MNVDQIKSLKKIKSKHRNREDINITSSVFFNKKASCEIGSFFVVKNIYSSQNQYSINEKISKKIM